MILLAGKGVEAMIVRNVFIKPEAIKQTSCSAIPSHIISLTPNKLN
jgi:hypothetical protein